MGNGGGMVWGNGVRDSVREWWGMVGEWWGMVGEWWGNWGEGMVGEWLGNGGGMG